MLIKRQLKEKYVRINNILEEVTMNFRCIKLIFISLATSSFAIFIVSEHFTLKSKMISYTGLGKCVETSDL